MKNTDLKDFLHSHTADTSYKEKYEKLPGNRKGILDYYLEKFASELGDNISLQLLEKISAEKFWLYSGDTFKLSGASFKLIVDKNAYNAESSVIAIKNKQGEWKPIGCCQSFKHFISPENEGGLNVIELVIIRIDPHATQQAKINNPDILGFEVMTDAGGKVVFDTFRFVFSTVEVEYKEGLFNSAKLDL